jgi:pimeloyl-ACP methyl ester carboxylesterase
MRTHDGLALHVQVEGPEHAELTVVLAHCWTSDHDSWRYQVRDLRTAYGSGIRIISYDHRGHGASDETPEHTATVDNLGRDLSDLIDAYAPAGELVLAGHSLGGMTIMALAERRPELFTERVAGVVFVATSGGGLDSVTLGLPEVGARAKAQIPRMLALRSRMLSRRRRRRAPVIESLVARRFLFGDDMRLRDHMLAVEGIINTPAASMCGFYKDLMTHDRHAPLGVLADVPVHVLVGAKDRLTPPSHARKLAEAIPGARLTVVPGAGHMLPLECDRLVSSTLVEVVDRVRGSAAVPAHRADSLSVAARPAAR